jgi:hypothetical protein
VHFKVLRVDRAEFYQMKITESSQHAEFRVTCTGVVLSSYDSEEGKCFFYKVTHCCERIDVMGTQVFGCEI